MPNWIIYYQILWEPCTNTYENRNKRRDALQRQIVEDLDTDSEVTTFITDRKHLRQAVLRQVDKATETTALTETGLMNCVKVEVAVLGSPSLIRLMISVDVKQH